MPACSARSIRTDVREHCAVFLGMQQLSTGIDETPNREGVALSPSAAKQPSYRALVGTSPEGQSGIRFSTSDDGSAEEPRARMDTSDVFREPADSLDLYGGLGPDQRERTTAPVRVNSLDLFSDSLSSEPESAESSAAAVETSMDTVAEEPGEDSEATQPPADSSAPAADADSDADDMPPPLDDGDEDTVPPLDDSAPTPAAAPAQIVDDFAARVASNSDLFDDESEGLPFPACR